jgi:hypothetical protein
VALLIQESAVQCFEPGPKYVEGLALNAWKSCCFGARQNLTAKYQGTLRDICVLFFKKIFNCSLTVVVKASA